MSSLFGPIAQAGYVVRDVEQAIEHWASELGIGPFFRLDHARPDNYRYAGVLQEEGPDLTIALAYSGDLQIELIQQNDDTPSLYKEFLTEADAGLHHWCFFTNSYSADYQCAIDRGLSIGHEGSFGDDTRFAYFRTDPRVGTMCELAELAPATSGLFDALRKAARDWDGKNALFGNADGSSPDFDL